jgi:acyl carrier protein
MSAASYEQLSEIIFGVVAPKFEEAGYDRNTIQMDTDLMEFLDSFAFLDVILDIEGRAGVSVDLSQMNIGKALTLNFLTQEIIRINSLG